MEKCFELSDGERLLLGIFNRASEALARDFRVDMSQEEARANLEARASIFNFCNQILEKHGAGITLPGVEGALIIKRELGTQEDPHADGSERKTGSR